MATMQKIASNLWFNDSAEEAVKFYTTIFKNSKVGRTARYGKEGQEIHGRPPGSVMTIEFWLEGMEFVALNGGPHFKFNEAISFIVHCDNQQEIDYYWDKLNEGGDPKSQMCGWLKDKFGVSWQIVPRVLSEMAADPDERKSQNVMRVVLQMKKLDLAAIEKAYREQD